jgi:undecaprenyl-diphosphatase
MTIIQALILGAVQGLTEFLPVSSSGHLVLVQRLLGVTAPALLFDTVLHCGTLAAVFLVLRREILALLRKPLQPLTLGLVIATIPAALAGLAFKAPLEKAFSSGAFLGVSFIITAGLLFFSEMLSSRNKEGGPVSKPLPSAAASALAPPASGYLPGCPDASSRTTPQSVSGKSVITITDALVIGLFQALAIVPGISRSGATISGALLRRLDRDFAARFAMLLSIPVILGALILQLKDLGESAAAIGAAPLAAGAVSSALTGIMGASLMLAIIRTRKLLPFALYTLILGVVVLAGQFLV